MHYELVIVSWDNALNEVIILNNVNNFQDQCQESVLTLC